MSKEKNRGNREAKKPKKVQPKIPATANANAGKTGKATPTIGGSKVR